MKTSSNKSTDAAHSSQSSLHTEQGNRAFREANTAATPFFQAKLAIGPPNDHYEQEADRIADQVVENTHHPADGSFFTSPPVPLQRQEEDRVQAKPLVQQISPLVQPQTEEELLQAKPIFESPGVMDLHRGQADDLLQGKDAQQSPPSGFASRLDNSKGGGQPLADATRSQMEDSFGTDFSGVRVHTDSGAVQMSRDIGAQAFTHGNDVYFNAGKYRPGTTSGDHLLAHELTHTVQQGGVQRKLIQKEEDETTESPTPKAVGEVAPISEGRISEYGNSFKLSLINFPVKHNFSPLIDGPPYRFPVSGTRNTHQDRVWKRHLRPVIRERIMGILGASVNTRSKYMLSLKDNNTIRLVGTPTQLVNELIVPPFNQDGVPTTFQIEHILDWQIAGGDKDVDTIGRDSSGNLPNLILLEAGPNIAVGQRVLRERRNRINLVLDHYRDEGVAGLPAGSAQALTDPNFIIEASSIRSEIEILGSVVTSSTLNSDLRNPISERLLTAHEFQLPDGHFLLTTANNSAGYILPYNAEGYENGSFQVTTVGDPTTHQLTRLTLTPIVEENDQGLIQPVTQEAQDYEVEQKDTDTYKVKGLRNKLRNFFQLRPLSPVVLEEVEMGPGFNLQARGRVLPTVPIIRDADIRIEILGRHFSVFKEFNTGELQVPTPFELRNLGLVLGVSSSEGVFISGRADFGINNVGEGYLAAAATLNNSFSLEGGFNFDTQLFDPAEIAISYTDNVWTIGGRIGIPEGKLRGIRSAQIDVTYSEGTFTANGVAELDVPGVESGTLQVEYGNNQFTIGGSFALSSDIPGIQGGDVAVSVTKTPEGAYEVTAEGSAVPDIPGVSSRLTVAYDNGILNINGAAAYERGLLSGQLTLGATNRVFGDDGQPTDEIADRFGVYGGGELTLRITPWLAATAGVKFLPNGEIEIQGRIGLPNVVEVFSRRSFDRNLFRMPPLEIPLFAIPLGPRSLGLVARITGGLDFSAGIGPGEIRELFGEITYNPDRPEETHLTGGGQFVIPADAGLALRADLGLGLSVGIASLTGGIEVAGSLGLAGEAAAAINLDWTPQTGLALHAEGSITVNPKFHFDINAFARASLDLFLISLSKTWRKNLLAVEYGPDIQFGLRFPIDYIEGESFNISPEDVEPIYPNIDIGELAVGLGRSVKNQIF